MGHFLEFFEGPQPFWPQNAPLYVLPTKKNNLPDFQNQWYINSYNCIEEKSKQLCYETFDSPRERAMLFLCIILYQFCIENLNEKNVRFFKFFSENRGIAWLNKSATVASLLRIIGKDLSA